jgi:hypothetical protein
MEERNKRNIVEDKFMFLYVEIEKKGWSLFAGTKRYRITLNTLLYNILHLYLYVFYLQMIQGLVFLQDI